MSSYSRTVVGRLTLAQYIVIRTNSIENNLFEENIFRRKKDVVWAVVDLCEHDYSLCIKLHVRTSMTNGRVSSMSTDANDAFEI